MNADRQLVEIVVPVYDEVATLAANVEVLLAYLREEFPFRYRIVIADSAGVEGTRAVAASLAARHEEVTLLGLGRKGRGVALRTAWLASDADVVSTIDVDLSTQLESFLPLVAPVLSGHSELAVGTRLAHDAGIGRRLERDLVYNGLIRAAFRVGFSDARCGFKAIRADVARRLLPFVEDDGSFFDTELLLLAERNGLRIHEVPVDRSEDLDSRVELLPAIAADLRGLWRMRRSFWRGRRQ